MVLRLTIILATTAENTILQLQKTTHSFETQTQSKDKWKPMGLIR